MCLLKKLHAENITPNVWYFCLFLFGGILCNDQELLLPLDSGNIRSVPLNSGITHSDSVSGLRNYSS